MSDYMHPLNERIADVLMEQWPNTITRRDAALVTADAILALEEMHNLSGAAFMAMTEYPNSRPRVWCDQFLMKNVREWVLGE